MHFLRAKQYMAIDKPSVRLPFLKPGLYIPNLIIVNIWLSTDLPGIFFTVYLYICNARSI